jgi:hypothetical protein
LLWVNVGLACFVALAHGGALALKYSKPTPDAESIRQLTPFSLSLAAVVIVTAAAALIRVEFGRRVLGVHGVILVGSAAALLLWAAHILFSGIPEGKFIWSVGFLTAFVGYSVFVLCRFTLPLRLRTHDAVLYAPAIALAVAAVVDIGVLVRLGH